MRPMGPEEPAALDGLIQAHVPTFGELPAAEQGRLRELARDLQQRGMPLAFVASSLRSTAEVLKDLREEAAHRDAVFQREHVRRFVEQNAVPETSQTQTRRYFPRRERKREERETLLSMTQNLIREARLARGRHEVKKTRSMLLKVDQRELRRVLGREGDDLCRQINTWLRSTSAMF